MKQIKRSIIAALTGIIAILPHTAVIGYAENHQPYDRMKKALSTTLLMLLYIGASTL